MEDAQFTIGDAVRIARAGLLRGLIGKVVAVQVSCAGVLYAVSFNLGTPIWFRDFELERAFHPARAS